MTSEITLFGEHRCRKTRFYQGALEERGLSYEMADVDKNPDAAARLTALVGSADKFPTFEISGRKLRNPTLPNLDKFLARAGLYDVGVVHDKKSQKFVRHMTPSDAFASYVWQGDRMVLGHIEVDPTHRSSGLGTRFATEVLEYLETAKCEIRLTCPFLRRVGSTRERWKAQFNLKDIK